MTSASIPKRVLIVDDATALLEVLAERLRQAGHEVGTAVDGQDGLTKFYGGEWDVIVTDLLMPLLNGEEMTAAIQLAAPETPVILITGSPGTVQNPSVFFALVSKPFEVRELLKLVEAAPGASGRGRQNASPVCRVVSNPMEDLRPNFAALAKQPYTSFSPMHPSTFTVDQIAATARQIWEAEGRPEGKADEHWFRAEAQLHQQELEIAADAAAVPIPPAPAGLS